MSTLTFSFSGYNLAAACERGQYVALDAGETLAKIMVNGVPDERRFDDVVGSLIA
ncbi:MAG: hypothetical protein ACT4OO_03050 [Nitrospiraceae bacterium]